MTALLIIVGLVAMVTFCAAAQAAAAPDPPVGGVLSAYAEHLTGDPYIWGGTSPEGFDCSGLAQYVYAHFGKRIPRDAESQFLTFRPVSQADAEAGDLVFFHDAGGFVYHVGIYEGGGVMVSALNYFLGVLKTPLSWGGAYVTFGTILH